MSIHAFFIRVFSGRKRDFGIVVHYYFVNFNLHIGVGNGRMDPVIRIIASRILGQKMIFWHCSALFLQQL